jgi:hypothetical protein
METDPIYQIGVGNIVNPAILNSPSTNPYYGGLDPNYTVYNMTSSGLSVDPYATYFARLASTGLNPGFQLQAVPSLLGSGVPAINPGASSLGSSLGKLLGGSNLVLALILVGAAIAVAH